MGPLCLRRQAIARGGAVGCASCSDEVMGLRMRACGGDEMGLYILRRFPEANSPDLLANSPEIRGRAGPPRGEICLARCPVNVVQPSAYSAAFRMVEPGAGPGGGGRAPALPFHWIKCKGGA